MSISTLFVIVYIMSLNSNGITCSNKSNILNRNTVKAPLTFLPHWKCANTWRRQTWSWKKTHNIWWTFRQEWWPFSFCYLFVFFFFTSSSPSCKPFYQLLSCWVVFVHPSVLCKELKGTNWSANWIVDKCMLRSNKCMKVCWATWVSTLLRLCRLVLL